MLELLTLVCDDLSCLCLKRGCFDTGRACRCSDTLIHALGVAAVGSCLDVDAQVLPVLIGAAAGCLLCLAPGCSKGVVCARAGVLLVGQQSFPFGLRYWLQFNPMGLEPISTAAFFLPECGHG